MYNKYKDNLKALGFIPGVFLLQKYILNLKGADNHRCLFNR